MTNCLRLRNGKVAQEVEDGRLELNRFLFVGGVASALGSSCPLHNRITTDFSVLICFPSFDRISSSHCPPPPHV